MTGVSAIIAARNAQDTVARAVLSVLRNGPVCEEVIVVDDGSTDGTSEAALTTKDPRVRVLRSDSHLGRARARNLAVSESTCDFLAIQDADDVSWPDRLKLQLNALMGDDAPVGVGAQCVSLDPRRGYWKHASYPTDPDDIARGLQSGVMTICHTSLLLRRSAFDAAGGYDPAYERGQDLAMLAIVSRLGRLINLPKPLVTYVHNVHLPWRYWRLSRRSEAMVRGKPEMRCPVALARYAGAELRRELVFRRTHSGSEAFMADREMTGIRFQ